jgi:sugar/nucleoside kinase (ribokinase family)
MSSPASAFDLIGVGSPIMDLLAPVPESFLATVRGDKGGMVLVDDAEMQSIVTRLPVPPAAATGGSAANTTFNVARLGLRTAFLGKLGNDDNARIYRERFAAVGVDGSRFKQAAQPNARCLSLVTPDAQRTMRTCLGAAMTLAPEEITAADFKGCRHAHVEGYLLFNRALAEAVLAAARAAGCTLSIDLASFEVAAAARDWLLAQLGHGVDIVFASRGRDPRPLSHHIDRLCRPHPAPLRRPRHARRGETRQGRRLRVGPAPSCTGPSSPSTSPRSSTTTRAGDAFPPPGSSTDTCAVSGRCPSAATSPPCSVPRPSPTLGPLVPSQDWSAIAQRVQQFR